MQWSEDPSQPSKGFHLLSKNVNFSFLLETQYNARKLGGAQENDCATFTTPTFTTPDIHHPQCKMRHSPPPTFTTPDVHHPQCKLRHSSPPTFTTPDIHHPRHSPPPCKMRRSSPPNLGQFGTGTILAPLPIWHRSQFDTKSVKGTIW